MNATMETNALAIARRALEQIVEAMALSKLPPRQRLTGAAVVLVHDVLPLLDNRADVPPEISVKAVALWARLTEHGSWQETLPLMSDAEVRYVIGELVSLYGMLAEAAGPGGMEEENDLP